MFAFWWNIPCSNFMIMFAMFLFGACFAVAWFYLMYKLIVRPRPTLDNQLLSRGLNFKNYALVNIDKILIAILMGWLSPIGLAFAIYFLRADYLRIEELEQKNLNN